MLHMSRTSHRCDLGRNEHQKVDEKPYLVKKTLLRLQNWLGRAHKCFKVVQSYPKDTRQPAQYDGVIKVWHHEVTKKSRFLITVHFKHLTWHISSGNCLEHMCNDEVKKNWAIMLHTSHTWLSKEELCTHTVQKIVSDHGTWRGHPATLARNNGIKL